MSAYDDIRKAVETDAGALAELAANLDQMSEPLDAAAGLIAGMDGRLILTGVGKSGHIAAKLAATFASTGTPAYFLHPVEASHGDLGMVHPSDVILALSWSGETRELSDVIGYAKRRGVPLISLTSGAASTLAQASDVAIVLPKVREACPHNLAPTTSTMLQLVMGDALAIALLQMKGFSEESFHGFHPAGSLGAALKRVREIMHEGEALPLVAGEASVFEALSELSRQGHGIVGVTEAEALVGVITDGDVRRYLERNAASTMQAALHDQKAKAIMTIGSVTMEPDQMVGEAMRVLQSRRISAAFVVEGAKPVGLITMLRLLNRGAA